MFICVILDSSIFVFICVARWAWRGLSYYDTHAKLGRWVGLVGNTTHCALSSFGGGNGGIPNKSVAEWAQVQKRAA